MNIVFCCAIVLILLVILYIFIVRPWLQKRGLSAAQLQLLDFAAQKGVLLAEQLFISGRLPKYERKKAALKAAGDMLRETGVVPERYLSTINNLIEAAVRELPKTNAGGETA